MFQKLTDTIFFFPLSSVQLYRSLVANADVFAQPDKAENTVIAKFNHIQCIGAHMFESERV